jgi:hypothetical protein
MSGAIQTQGSCWFYGILNELILSYDIGRLLYKHIDIEFKKMTPDEREFFMSSVRAPCPLGINFKKIYFYKFLDQYFCTSGPGQYLKKAGRSLSLVGKVLSAGSTVRRVTSGSYPNIELPRVLKTLGISCAFVKTPQMVTKNTNTEMCAIAPGLRSWFPITQQFEPFIGEGRYRLAAASIAIRNKNKDGLHAGHALTATIDSTGNGILFDSASGKRITVNWLKPEKLKHVINTQIAPEFYGVFFKNGQVTITDYGFSHVIYVKKEAVKGVAPACRLNRMRKTPGYNMNYMYLPFFKTAASLRARLNRNVKAGLIAPVNRQKIIKKFKEKARSKIRGNLSVVRGVIESNMSRASIERYLQNHFVFSPRNRLEVNKFLENKFKTVGPKARREEPWNMKANLQINLFEKAKGSVNRLKTIKARKEYLKQSTLKGANLVNLKRYIAMKNEQQRELKRVRQSRTPAPK